MKQKTLTIVLILLVLVTGAYSVFQSLSAPCIAYVDLTKAYNEFEMKKELEKKFENTMSTRQAILDSLKFRLQQMSLSIQSMGKTADRETRISEFGLLKQEYQQKQGSFEESNNVLLQTYEKDIWNQLNKYAELFSKEEGYDLILGANGSGNVMFGKKRYEVTDAFVKFINSKNSGK